LKRRIYGLYAESTDPLYKHIPFYICENSAGAYGIFYDTSATSYMDLGKEINNYYEPYKYFKTEDNCLIYYVFFGTKIRDFAAVCIPLRQAGIPAEMEL
jgi:alpha-glucosidase